MQFDLMIKHLISTVFSYAQAGLKRFASVRPPEAAFDLVLFSGESDNISRLIDLPAYPEFVSGEARRELCFNLLADSLQDLTASLSGLFEGPSHVGGRHDWRRQSQIC